MKHFIFYTLCIPFIDIYITNPGIVRELGLRKNEMTMYSHLTKEQQNILSASIEETKNTRAYYGGMSYNTCAEIAKKQENIRVVFIGPFSTDRLTHEVFSNAIMGNVNNLEILPEFVNSESGRCFVIPNGRNRAMITKTNDEQVVSKGMVDKFIECVNSSEDSSISALYISGYTVESSAESMQYLLEQKRRAKKCISIFNLADPGVIDRIYEKVRCFIKESDWVIGNEDEYNKLFMKEVGRAPGSREEMHRHVQKSMCNAVITAGPEETVVLYEKPDKNGIKADKSKIAVKPKEIEVNNTTGAGDVFAASFFSSILKEEETVEESLNRAIKRTNSYLLKLSGKRVE
ncbi:adenosine kinase [Nematocida minor]|uniref:adenosine kinase n=1 Tax=Nematocida minor TaxID=1912983 RepID=UPI00221FAA16|nr:adenosine kinase [Nematocida minor]KAI5190720.1 adenosine kinase [Nematocida minor]